MQQRVQHGPLPITAAGVDHQPGRLVDDDEIVILVDDVQRNSLRRMAGFDGAMRWLDLDFFSAPHFLPGDGISTINADTFFPYPGLQAAARPVRQQLRQSLVKRAPAKFRGI